MSMWYIQNHKIKYLLVALMTEVLLKIIIIIVFHLHIKNIETILMNNKELIEKIDYRDLSFCGAQNLYKKAKKHTQK